MNNETIQTSSVVDQPVTEETPEEGNSEEKRKDPVATFEVKLTDFDKAIDVSLDDASLQSYVGKYGFDIARLEEGKLEIANTTQKRDFQKLKKAEQLAATREFHAKMDKAKKTLNYHSRLGRLIYRNDPDMLDKLVLRGRRRRRYGDWVVDAESFYTTVLSTPEAIEAFAQYNVPLEELQAGQQEVLDTKAAAVSQQKAKAEAEQATAEKNKAFRVLESWMRKYLTVVDLACEDVPQYKEKVGIIVPYLKR